MSKHNKTQEYVLRMSKKIKGIMKLGGRCSKCGEQNILVLTFHHASIADKEDDIAALLSRKWSVIDKELEKCVLLCRNCHAAIHNEGFADKEVKIRLLKLKGDGSCEKCKYSGCHASLEFHHVDPLTKELQLGRLNNNYLSDKRLAQVVREIEKCQVLCSNCHFIEHLECGKFEKYKKDIYAKINSYHEMVPVDREAVARMRDSGMKIIEIANCLGRHRTTIGDILLDR